MSICVFFIFSNSFSSVVLFKYLFSNVFSSFLIIHRGYVYLLHFLVSIHHDHNFHHFHIIQCEISQKKFYCSKLQFHFQYLQQIVYCSPSKINYIYSMQYLIDEMVNDEMQNQTCEYVISKSTKKTSQYQITYFPGKRGIHTVLEKFF